MNLNDYVGIPFAVGGRTERAVDCWGLVMQVYRKEFNVALSDFLGDHTASHTATLIDEPVDGCLVRAVNSSSGADHWGVYYKGHVLNAQMPHSAAPKLKQFISRFPSIKFYEVAPDE
jgi:cell wall-associated NlpC family hydrolase